MSPVDVSQPSSRSGRPSAFQSPGAPDRVALRLPMRGGDANRGPMNSPAPELRYEATVVLRTPVADVNSTHTTQSTLPSPLTSLRRSAVGLPGASGRGDVNPSSNAPTSTWPGVLVTGAVLRNRRSVLSALHATSRSTRPSRSKSPATTWGGSLPASNTCGPVDTALGSNRSSAGVAPAT